MNTKIILTWLLLTLILAVNARYFSVKNGRYFDPDNGQIIFHGLNHVEKIHPYQARLTDKQIQDWKSWGINGIRTDIAWPGLEPKKGEWNQTYLKYKLDLINKLGENGIYTLLQFHQDLFSEKFYGGGVPLWIIPQQIYHDYARPIYDGPISWDENGIINDGHILTQQNQWARYYGTYSINRAFKALYANQYGILDGFKRYWKKIAETFKDNKYIIAFEIINEPWPGNMYKNPLIMIPGLSEAFNLQGFHDQVARQIRTVDPDVNICFEPVTWLNGIPAGFSHAPGGKQYADRSILCWHYYNPPTKGMHIFIGARKLDMKRLGVGGLMTEFMAVPNADEGTDPNEYFEQILDISQKQHISWFAWNYGSGLNLNFIVRTYAQRTGGKVVQQKFNTVSKIYHLYYEANPDAGLTRIFFSKRSYPNGFILTLDPKVPFTVTEGRFILIDSKHIGRRLMMVKLEVPDLKKQMKEKFDKEAVTLEDATASKKKQSMMKEQPQMKQSTNGTKIGTKQASSKNKESRYVVREEL